MTERERWIVYPLLFLALGAALRDKLIKQTFSERIECEVLVCNDIVCRRAVQAQQVVRTPLLEADNVSAVRVNGGAISQGGQPVLSISPQYLPQFLQRLGLWQGGQPAAPQTRPGAPPRAAEAADPAGASD